MFMDIIEENKKYSEMVKNENKSSSLTSCNNDCASDDGGCPSFCDWEWGS